MKTTDRLPPHAPDAEKALLGSAMMDPASAVSECVVRGVKDDWFYDIRNQAIFTTMCSMVDRGITVDLVTLATDLQKTGLLGKVGLAYVGEIAAAGISPANIPFYADILEGLWLARKSIKICTEAVAAIYDSPANVQAIMDKAESDILTLREPSTRTIPTMRDLAIKVTDRIEERLKGKRGLATGFLDLDKLTNGGMQNSEFWVVAARPNVGKTALACNVGAKVAEVFIARGDGEHVAIFSLEMEDAAIAERELARRAKLNTRAKLTMGDLPKLALHAPSMAKLPIIIDDTAPLDIRAIKARARRYHKRFNAKLFIVDYLQLIEGDSSARDDNRRTQVDAISRGIKSLAKELRVPFLVVAQLNRDLEKEGGGKRKPRMADLRESGQIEQDADVILFLYDDPKNPTTLGPSDPRTILCRIGKQRNGPRDIDIPLTFFPDQTRFENGSMKP